MGKIIQIKKGLDIKIFGKAEKTITKVPFSETFEINPDFFHGIIPKMLVKEGDKIQAGTPLFFNKAIPEMMFVSPVSGIVTAVNRGDRRKVLSVSIKSDIKIDYLKFEKAKLTQTQDDLKTILLKSGLWTLIKQRPYDVIANPSFNPKNIFVSTFDTSPLAPDYEFILKDKLTDFQTGIDALKKLTNGVIFLGLQSENSIFNSIKNVETTVFKGNHPAGNVGVQINKTAPINKGETVWTINAQDVAIIGSFLNTGIVDFTKIVALTGPEIKNPQYFEIIAGGKISDLLKNNLFTNNYQLRYISGNVLTGTQIAENSFLSPYDNQLTVIAEGNETHELFGWAMPRINKFSASYLYFTKLFSNKKFNFDARLLGGRRAIIMSGEYDKVFPMDIYPEFLIKAMIANNIEKMENLGAYEVAPEDFALPEFVCSSKLPLQAIVRDALDFMKKELE